MNIFDYTRTILRNLDYTKTPRAIPRNLITKITHRLHTPLTHPSEPSRGSVGWLKGEEPPLQVGVGFEPVRFLSPAVPS